MSVSERRTSKTTPRAGIAPSYTRDDALSDALERWRLPALFASLLALIGGARFDTTRPLEAMFIALALPLVAAVAGAAPFWYTKPLLRTTVFGFAASVFFVSELVLTTTLFGEHSAGAASFTAGSELLIGLLAAAVLLEAVAARSGVRSRLAAWVGMAVGLSLYLPGHFNPKELFGSVLVALLVALLVGGGAGLLLGALASHWTRRA